MLTLFNSHFQCSRILRSPTRWCSATNATFVFTRSDNYLNIKPWLRPSHVPCQACYGITNIPSGPWLCRTCTLEIKPPCELCPNKVKIFAAVKKYLQAHPVWKIFIVLKNIFGIFHTHSLFAGWRHEEHPHRTQVGSRVLRTLDTRGVHRRRREDGTHHKNILYSGE